MPDTPASLLERLRDRPDAEGWKRLVDLYTPLLEAWLRRYSVPPHDAEDLTQDVLGVLVQELPRFHRQRRGSFRSWLRIILVNRLRAHWRSQRFRPLVPSGSQFLAMLDQLEDPACGLSQLWNREHDRQVLRRLLEMIQPEFEPKTWQAFGGVMFDGHRPAEVAVELGMSVHAVVVAKSKVLKRLRQVARDLVE